MVKVRIENAWPLRATGLFAVAGGLDKDGKPKSAEELEEMLVRLFSEIDSDGSGHLDRSEVEELSGRLGTKLTSLQLNTAMMQMDEDGSGEVDLDEFRVWWQKQASAGEIDVAPIRTIVEHREHELTGQIAYKVLWAHDSKIQRSTWLSREQISKDVVSVRPPGDGRELGDIVVCGVCWWACWLIGGDIARPTTVHSQTPHPLVIPLTGRLPSRRL